MLTSDEKNNIERLIRDFEKEIEARKIEKEFKVSIEEEGILMCKSFVKKIDVLMKMSEILIEFLERNQNRIPANLKVLIETTPAINLSIPLNFRKKIIEGIKAWVSIKKFSKIAAYGHGKIKKALIPLIFSYLELKNFKYFETKEEALQWLRED